MADGRGTHPGDWRWQAPYYTPSRPSIYVIEPTQEAREEAEKRAEGATRRPFGFSAALFEAQSLRCMACSDATRPCICGHRAPVVQELDWPGESEG